MSTITQSPETNFATVTSWLPLTTAWPSQAGCSSYFWARWGFNQSAGFDAVAFDPGYGITANPDVSCLPPAATSWWDPAIAGSVTSTIYSVGPIVCPQAYTTAGTSSVGTDRTFVACCPSGYDFVSLFSAGQIGQCTSPIESGAVITYYMLNTPGVDDSGVTLTSTTMSDAYRIVGVPINGLNFAQLAIPTTATTVSSIPSQSAGIAQSTSSSPPLPSPSQSTSTSESPGSSGLSSGAQAGIGVGVSLVILAIVGILCYAFLRRKRRSNSHIVDVKEYGDITNPAELDHRQPFPTQPVEMAATQRTRSELPG